MFKFIKRRRIKNLQKLEDIYASSVFVSPLIQRMKKPVSFNQYSLRPFAIAILSNEILMNKRGSYLEFGGGISTILLAKFIEMNKLSTRMVVVENDIEWINYIKNVLKEEGLSQIVEFVHAPLVSTPSPFGDTSWFNQEVLISQLSGISFDLVLVDGPPGLGGYHRYNAVPFLKSNSLLSSGYSIYLDDVNRKQERLILHHWNKEFGITFQTILNQIAASRTGNSMKIQLSN
ncbi:MAG: hypothetical protein GY816_13390 [Cytophagales bacterium]|nr:hypothetical protein [Cytophagales bacterium]